MPYSWSGNINNSQLKLRIKEILLTEYFQTYILQP